MVADGDDGTREKGVQLEADVGGGWFSNIKWGTEVDVVGTEKKSTKPFRDNSDRGLSGSQSYRNTESARLGGYEGQQIRKQKLEAYINSDEAPADKTFGKILAGTVRQPVSIP